jgi:hypothetical protein
VHKSFREAGCVLVFVSSEEAKEVAVGEGAKGLGAVAVVLKETCREGSGRAHAIFDFKAVERGQGNAVSAIEVAEGFKEVGFELVVSAAALGFGARVLGSWLRRRIGAGSFMNSHRCLLV